MVMGTYSKIRKYSSDVHVYEFNPEDERLDVTIGKYKKLEKLSKINGEPTDTEKVVAKINGGFFAMNGSTEFIGSYVDGPDYYQKSAEYYPTLVYWKENKMAIENDPPQSRHAYYQGHAWWAIGVPWTLIIDGKKNFQYDKKTLISIFGHPYQRQPRTLLGQKADGTIVMVVVDGRRSNSLGVTCEQSAAIMLELGCTIAVNLDGGGSSEMIVNDTIKNKPSGGAERAIGTAFIVYGKKEYKHAKDMIVSASSLIVRSGPGTSYSKKGSLSKGTKVRVLETSITKWYKIEYGNGIGYVYATYLKDIEVTPTAPTTIQKTVKALVLNVRSGAGTTHSKIGKLYLGNKVEVYSDTGVWSKIDYNGKEAYVSSQYLK